MSAALEAAWQAAEAEAAGGAPKLLDLFAAEPDRAERLRIEAAGLTFDFSKTRFSAALAPSLFALAEAADIAGGRTRMAAGAAINTTENRAVLHMALRGDVGARDPATGAPVAPIVAETRARIAAFARDFAAGRIIGAGGLALDQIVHIGIGGSDLGPRLVVDALADPAQAGPLIRFAGNVDGAEIADALHDLDPARTLIVVVSKTFTTQETMANAGAARDWLVAALGGEAASRHICAVTAALERAQAWGAAQVFPFWDWVGGRYSLWSAVGLTIALAVGAEAFERLLDGAATMDRHFLDAPISRNAPILSALIHAADRSLYGAASYALIAYARRLQLAAPFLQQLEMESNGKGVDRDGRPLTRLAAGVTWGEPGTNAQHSFFQLLHQGRDAIPVEFLIVERGHKGPSRHRALLTANALAQAEALLRGKTAAEAEAEMRAAGIAAEDARQLAPHRAFTGDRASTIIALPTLSPEALGALLAFYEHRTFAQGLLYNINSFDQWGVELGKQLANAILAELDGAAPARPHDPSTAYWISRLR